MIYKIIRNHLINKFNPLFNKFRVMFLKDIIQINMQENNNYIKLIRKYMILIIKISNKTK
jgi:hypothetical protein